MKPTLIIIIVLVVLLVLAIAATIITAQAGVIANNELKARALAAEALENNLRVSIHQRDEILGTIDGKTAFKDWPGIKNALEKWKTLKAVEKESQK